jgi:hypothetical protein
VVIVMSDVVGARGDINASPLVPPADRVFKTASRASRIPTATTSTKVVDDKK